MISKKVFNADGSNTRFLSDFIIKSEQFTRVYNYVYDVNGVDGSIDPASGLYVRTQDAPNSDDLIGIDKWDLVDNSISFYIAPYAGSIVWIEVATTSEEFGDTLVQPSVERAEAAADAAELSEIAAATSEANAATSETNAGTSETNAAASASAAATSAANASTSETNAGTSETNAAASALAASTSEGNAAASASASSTSETNAAASEAAAAISETNAGTSETNALASENKAEKWADEAEDVEVEVGKYSAKHWAAKAENDIPQPIFPTDEGLALVARATGNDWEKILGLPLETGNAHKTVTTDGVEGDSYWSPFVTSPNVVDTDFAMTTGANASIVSPTINDGVTITIPDGSTLVIL